MYSDKFFQTFRSRYKTEGEPNEISINSFCINQGVPYKHFYLLFMKHVRDTAITVEIDGTPHEIDTDGVDAKSQPANKPKIKKQKHVRIIYYTHFNRL